MNLRITIQLDNAAFAECPSEEIRRILDRINVINLWDGEAHRLVDYNGNIVGEARIGEDPDVVPNDAPQQND
tara:strand:+ start:10009 stop:10224 length:216 start_codon:yes stop_codon:yes gene_type:complete